MTNLQEGMMAIRGEIVEETPPIAVDNTMYVAVGNNLKESEMTLKWALHNSGGRKICVLHVHQPADKIPFMGAKVHISQLNELQVRAFHETERQIMHQLLEKYSLICLRAGIRAEKLHIEKDSIEKGIVELIVQHGITKLVMGAAADKSYSRKMIELKSKKAMYVNLHAPVSCHIFFICKGNLIYTREGRMDVIGPGVVSPSLQVSTNPETGHPSRRRSKSVIVGPIYQEGNASPAPNYQRVMSDTRGMKISALSPTDSSAASTPCKSSISGAFNDWSEIPRRSHSIVSRLSTCSSDAGDDSLISYAIAEGNENELAYSTGAHFKENLHRLSPPSVLERNANDELYDQLVQAMAEAENSKRDAFEESIRRRKAEKDALEAIRRVKASESIYAEELRRRREIEEALARDNEELNKIKQQLDEVMEDLRVALEQKSSLEEQIANSEQSVQELEQKICSAVDLLQSYKKEHVELQVKRDEALSIAENRRAKLAEEASSSRLSQFCTEFTLSEIEVATNNFHPELKIGEGGYGSIYKGFLRYTEVAVKMLHANSLQGPSEFQQEVNILGKLRHPNLVTLIGACPEACILIYEYLSGGSLEDRLSCKDNTPPLSWQTRIRIAAELCSILIFLHSCGIVHGDLKPANLLLDDNFVSKLSDFGICRILAQNEYSNNYTTRCYRTEQPRGTFAYIDPEFLSSGELTSKSDVYSFGIILLRLLTGKQPLGIANDVKSALDRGTLNSILDPTAGDWPFIQAKQLAHLGLSCCDLSRRKRPDLASDAWRVLEPMRVSCGVSSFSLGLEEQSRVPHYFMCPVFQEIMQDPVVASDGYTYEAEALQGWLDGGNETSPMTGGKLANSTFLPNHALRSAIQEWLQHT